MSQILELYFNTRDKASENGIFGTACFKAASKAEEKAGSLFCYGEVRNMPSKGAELLERIIYFSQKIYYDYHESSHALERFKFVIERLNIFLLEVPKKENFSWGGNLNLAILSIDQNLWLTASRAGNVKIFILRGGAILNMGDNLPSSAGGVFANSLDGQAEKGDLILVFNKELQLVFEQEKLLNILALSVSLKQVKKAISSKKKILRENKGCCLVILVQAEKKLWWPRWPKKPAVATRGLAYLRSASGRIEGNPLSSYLKNTLPASPKLSNIIWRIIISLALLALLLPLGYLIFKK